MQVNLNELQDRVYEIFCEFDRICRKHNIKYSMEGGTLMGAVKYQDFVPWDDDIDVVMVREEYEKFLQIAPGELDSKFFLQSYNNVPEFPLNYAKLCLNGTEIYDYDYSHIKTMHHGVFMDIFPIDDAVPSKSFFYFCKELLDRYENDTRVNKICGMNQVKDFTCPDSYFFANIGSLGWATWKRVADTWEENYEFLEDEYNINALLALRNKPEHKDYHKTCLSHKANGVPHWETVESYARFLNNQLAIVPCVNLIKNVGLGEDSTHSNLSLSSMPTALREAYYCDAKEMEFPLKHPKYVYENILYREAFCKITGRGHPFVKFKRKLAGICLRIKNGDFKSVVKGIKRRLHIK